jgi:hypothetical protein
MIEQKPVNTRLDVTNCPAARASPLATIDYFL